MVNLTANSQQLLDFQAPMAPKKKTVAQLQQLQNTQPNDSTIRTDPEARLVHCQNELAGAMSEIESLKLELSQAQDKCAMLEGLQEKSAKKIHDLKAQVLTAKEHQRDTYRKLHNEQCAHQHAVKDKNDLDEKISELKTEQHKKLKEMKELEKEKILATNHVDKAIKANQHLQNEISNISWNFLMRNYSKQELN